MNIGIIYNSFSNKNMLPEEEELKATSFAIGKSLLKLGQNVQYFDMDDPEDINKLCHSELDAAFDTCERIHGDPRGEAYAAALLEFLNIPHTRTRSFHISLGINKVRVKLILRQNGIPVPRFQIFQDEKEELRPDMNFPLFVKGIECENSIGIDEDSLVTDMEQLRKQVRKINAKYKQSALVEEFIAGREFSAAVLPGKNQSYLADH